MKKEGEFLGIKVMSSPAVKNNEFFLIGQDPIEYNQLRSKQFGRIVFDEYAEYPDWKWYRNPIKWWKWRRLWRTIKRNMP